MALLFGASGRAFCADPDVASSIISYQFFQATSSDANFAVSPLASYHFHDSVDALATNLFARSPIVSYQYFDWPGEEVALSILSSPSVSYSFEISIAQPVFIPPSPTQGAGVLGFSFPTSPAEVYLVEYKEHLGEPEWRWLASIHGDGQQASFFDEIISEVVLLNDGLRINQPQAAFFPGVRALVSRFYRIRKFSRGFLRFPLRGSGPSRGPYKTKVVAVFDHDGDPMNRAVRAYNGEVGSIDEKCYPSTEDCRVRGYKQENRRPFNLSLLTYDDEISPSKREYLFYDGHTGYDYPAASGTPIYAAARGRLVVASTRTQGNGVDLWRNEAEIGAVPGGTATLQWEKYHAFYIKHENGYSSWYLHASDLAPAIKAEVLERGYADITSTDQEIAFVGDFGAESKYHLHFGLRNGDVLDDPYSDKEAGRILWDEPP